MSIGILNLHPDIRLVNDHVKRYPKIQVQDVYKLLYQGEFGVKHIIDNPEAARAYLDKELEQSAADSSEPLWEYISSDSTMVRIHLRPFNAGHYNPEHLWEAMVKTAESVDGDTTRFEEHWRIFMQGIAKGLLPFSEDIAKDFWKDVENAGYPAVHHSPQYNEAYSPAYRVIGADYIEHALDKSRQGELDPQAPDK